MTLQAVLPATATATAAHAVPWYRQRWPWLLMIAPATAFAGGVVTFYLAVRSADPLVVDDYYRQGKAINLVLDRDRHASELGLAAVVASRGAGLSVTLTARDGAPLPAQLTLRLSHATRAELDRVAVVPGSSERGVYRRDDLALPGDGRWNVQIEPPDRAWRLVGVASDGLVRPLELRADAR